MKLWITALSVLFCTLATARTDYYRSPYGMAGCGLGSLLMNDNTKVDQTLAVTINSSASQIFNISSTESSSNCQVDDAMGMARLESKVYLEINFAHIVKDAAQGGGAYLRAFGEILGCNELAKSHLSRLSRLSFDTIFDHSTPDTVWQLLNKEMISDQTMIGHCSRLS